MIKKQLSNFGYLILASLFSAFVTAQKADNSQKQVDVYVAGSWYNKDTKQTYAAYWKNGKPVVLTNGQTATNFATVSCAKSIAVNGNDVYIAGDMLNADNKTVAAYWKNQQLQPLEIKQDKYKNIETSFASGVEVLNGNTFVFVNQSVVKKNYYYIKNGQEVIIPTELSPGVVNSRIHFVAGNDIYLANFTSEAAYWKNGHKVTLDNTMHYPDMVQLSSIFVSGNDVYAAGYKSYTSRGVNNSNRGMAVYWKNGQEVVLSTGYGRFGTRLTSSIFVDGKDVYVSGMSQDPNTGESTAVYWKNGQEVLLAKGPTFTQALSISVAGNDVYVAGENANKKVYWKNGKEIILPECSQISSMTLANGSGYTNKSAEIPKGTTQINKPSLSPKEESDLFFAENKKKPGIITLPSGLQYEIISQGTGQKPTASDRVKINFRRILMLGKEIKETSDTHSPVDKIVYELLPGLAQGLQLMNVGSKYKLFIPAKLGFGESKTPAYTLIFETELLEIIKQPTTAQQTKKEVSIVGEWGRIDYESYFNGNLQNKGVTPPCSQKPEQILKYEKNGTATYFYPRADCSISKGSTVKYIKKENTISEDYGHNSWHHYKIITLDETTLILKSEDDDGSGYTGIATYKRIQ